MNRRKRVFGTDWRAIGVEYLETVLSTQGRRLLIVEVGETRDDLVRDMVDVLTAFCARLYGRLGARNRVRRALTAAKARSQRPRRGEE